MKKLRLLKFRYRKQSLLLLVTLFFVGSASYLFPLITKATQDNTPPQLTAFALSPTSFTTESADVTLTLNVTLTDDQAGVCIASDCGSYSSSATQMRLVPNAGGSQAANFTNFTRTSGDALNGTYQATTVLPKGSQNGNWSVQTFLLVDKLGNSQLLTGSQVAAVPGATGTTVNNTAADSDNSPAQLTAFALSPTSFSTQSASATLTLNVTMTDNQAGVCIASDCGNYSSSASQMRLKANSGSQQVDFTNFSRTGGNDLNGTYTATATIPVGAQNGNWSVQTFLLVDKLGNSQLLTGSQVAAVPGATGTTVNNTAADSDSDAPQVTAFSITPTEFNTETADATLTLNMTLTDNMSGVCIASDCGTFYNSGGTQLTIAPLIGTQAKTFATLTRTSGNDKNGTYTAAITLPAHSKEGIWQVQYLLLVDKLGNTRTVSLSDLAALGASSSLTLINTADASSVTIEKDWTLSGSGGSVTFPAGTVVTRQAGGSFAFYKMVAQSYDISSVTSTDSLGGTVATIRTGIPGLNLSFSKDVTVSLTVSHSYDGFTLKVQSLGESDTHWSNETTCAVTDGTCSFTVNHATYFLVSSNGAVKTGAPGGTFSGK